MIISAKVKTRARENKIEKLSANNKIVNSGADNTFVVHTTKPAVDGQANEAVIKLIAEFFNVSKSAVSIKSGFTSKTKILEIEEN